MKVEQQAVPKFEPIVITIETQDELDELYRTIDNGPGSERLFWMLDELRASI
jgi:hypothetical protein